MKYNSSADYSWDGTDYFGASLASFDKLLRSKGYSLVGCNITGANAFFVRTDLVTGKFCQPLTPENHYEPARYWLSSGFVSGIRRISARTMADDRPLGLVSPDDPGSLVLHRRIGAKAKLLEAVEAPVATAAGAFCAMPPNSDRADVQGAEALIA